MSKWYEVKVTKVTVYAVEVEDSEGEEEAMGYALDEVFGGDSTAECSLAEGQMIDTIKRHADEILGLN